MKMEECSETLAIKADTPENNPKENIPYLKHGEILKSRKYKLVPVVFTRSMKAHTLAIF
jgi:hypothetical protein